MEALRALITLFFKLAIGLLFLALVWWLVSLMFPAISFSYVTRTIFASGEGQEKKDLLPSPRTYGSLFKPAAVPSATSNVFTYQGKQGGWGEVQGNQYYTYTDYSSFVTYGYGGTSISNDQQGSPSVTHTRVEAVSTKEQTPPPRTMYIRNISLYEGGPISSYLHFIGEARTEMFYNGVFPIVIVDTQGRVIGASPAYAKDTWSVPGWMRFEVKIQHEVPKGVPCFIVFEQGRPPSSSQEPVRVGMPVRCN